MSNPSGPHAFDASVLIQGYPGRSADHGGLGWSSVTLLEQGSERILVETGAFGARTFLLQQLAERGLRPDDVTGVLLTHAHWDHILNWPVFPRATIVIGRQELAWAGAQGPDHAHVSDLYARSLAECPRLLMAQDGQEVFPGIVAYAVPGHTPGHLAYLARQETRHYLFTGDAAKNRAELLSRTVDMTLDARASQASLQRIWALWTTHPHTVLIPGHDAPMTLKGDEPAYVTPRQASLQVWTGTDLKDSRSIALP